MVRTVFLQVDVAGRHPGSTRPRGMRFPADNADPTPRDDAQQASTSLFALLCAQAGAWAWNGMEVGMDWWGWVILALVIIAALVMLAVIVQRKRRRGGVIGLSDPGGSDSR
ncbi:MAG: hypothetical protein ACRDRO_20430 [Pseudonocardiaceae bacterium]